MVNQEMEFAEIKDCYLNALQSFNNSSSSLKNPALDDYLFFVAKTGRTLFEWPTIKNYFSRKLESVMNDVNETSPFDDLEQQPNTENCDGKQYVRRILKSVDEFDGIPFTIQRLAELLTNPKKHYKRADKFFRALEKNVQIVTTVNPEGERETNRNATTTPPSLHNGKSDDTIILINNSADNDDTAPSGGSKRSSTMDIDDLDDPDQHVAKKPKPMPSIETLWETAHNVDHVSSTSGGGALTLLDDEGGATADSNAPDTSLDSLSPSISRSMAGGAEDLLSKESYWSSTSSMGVSSSSLATMTPLQVPQLSSSSSTTTTCVGGAGGDVQTSVDESSTAASPSNAAYCTLPSVEVTFGDFDDDPTMKLDIGPLKDRPDV